MGVEEGRRGNISMQKEAQPMTELKLSNEEASDCGILVWLGKRLCGVWEGESVLTEEEHKEGHAIG